MAEQKTTPVEEAKWWIDRGPVKEREKTGALGQGIVEKWVFEMLKDYSQEQAVRNVVDINPRILREFSMAPGEWGYFSLGVGKYPANGLDKIKNALPLPPGARGLILDAGYSVRVIMTGEPVGERYVDINFTEGPSLDYWVGGELVEEQLFSSLGDALKRIRPELARYLTAPGAA